MQGEISPLVDRGTCEPVSLGAVLVAGKKVAPDATLLLTQDHREAMGYFDWYETAADRTAKSTAANKLCTALRVHMQVEEEIFYPEARAATGDDSLLDHAEEEHAQARELVDRIEAAIESGKAPDDTVQELRRAIEDHVEEEETQLFPELRETDMDLWALGRRLTARRAECLFRLTGRSAGNGSQITEDHMTPISKDEAQSLFIAGLRDVHAAAAQCKDMVEKQLERIENYPQVRERLEAHLEEKNAQLARVQEILESLGERPSTMKDAAMKMGGKLTTMMSAGTEDEIVKNSLAMFGLASFEAASYESLVVLATAARQQAAARKLQECLSEERAMSAWLAENLTGVVLMHLQYRSEGVPASR